MSKLEIAARQALDALEVSTDWDVGAKGKQLQSMKAITTLREALDHFADAGNKVSDHIAASGKVILTEEQAQKIEEALAFAASHSEYLADDLILYGEALATIRAARAKADHIAASGNMVREPVFKARKAFWKVALGNNTKLANLAKAAIDEVEKYANPVQQAEQEPVCECHRKTSAVISSERDL